MLNLVTTASSPPTIALQIVPLKTVHAKAILNIVFCVKQIQSIFIVSEVSNLLPINKFLGLKI